MEKLIDQETSDLLKKHFEEMLVKDVDLVVYSDQINELSQFAWNLCRELAELSPKIHSVLKNSSEAGKKGYGVDPTITIGSNLGYNVLFSGTPAGHEANTIVEAVKILSRAESGLGSEELEWIQAVDSPVNLKVFVTPSCPYCPQSAIQAIGFSAENALISAEIIEAQENPDLAAQYQVASVPVQVINNEPKLLTVGVQPPKVLAEQAARAGSKRYDELANEKARQEAVKFELSDNPQKAVHLNEENFEKALALYPKLVVDFWAEWCVPCRMLSPAVEALAEEMAGRVVFGKLNSDQNQNLAAKYEIASIPCLLFFQDGKLINRLTGARPKETLAGEVAKIFKLITLV